MLEELPGLSCRAGGVHGELGRRCPVESVSHRQTQKPVCVCTHTPHPPPHRCHFPNVRCWISQYQTHTEILKNLQKAGKAVSREWEFCQRSRTSLCEERSTSSIKLFHLGQKLFVFCERVLIDVFKQMFWETALLFPDRKGQPCCHRCRFLPGGISLLA